VETIAFFNLKGGVGKTTSAVNIAWHAANEGIPTLIWDLDPQGASTWFLKAKAKNKVQPKHFLSGKTPIGDLVKPTDYDNLDIIPAGFNYRFLEQQLHDKSDHGKHNLIQKMIEPFGERYGLIILDCTPSFSLVTEQIFDSADSLFVPIIPTHLSLRTYEQTHAFFKEHKLKPKRLHAFFTMVDRRRSLHRVMTEHPPASIKNRLHTTIPYAAVVERMGDHRAPLPAFDSTSPVSQAYANLWQDIKGTLAEFS
jgi:chromosome partitioning protein